MNYKSGNNWCFFSAERWNAAIFYYQEMLNNREQCCTSPPNSPVEFGSDGKLSVSGKSREGSLIFFFCQNE